MPKVLKLVTLGYRRYRFRRRRARRGSRKQLAHALGKLRAIASPVVNAVTLQLHRRRSSARIVDPDNFNRPAITRTVLFDHNYTVMRLLPRSNARQTNHQHWECLSKRLFWVTNQPVCIDCDPYQHQPQIRNTQHLSMAEIAVFSND
jgi:hypothetical protein